MNDALPQFWLAVTATALAVIAFIGWASAVSFAREAGRRRQELITFLRKYDAQAERLRELRRLNRELVRIIRGP